MVSLMLCQHIQIQSTLLSPAKALESGLHMSHNCRGCMGHCMLIRIDHLHSVCGLSLDPMPLGADLSLTQRLCHQIARTCG